MVGNTGWGGVDATQVADNMAGIIASHSPVGIAQSRWASLWQADASFRMTLAALF
jgi:hypothetical protein